MEVNVAIVKNLNQIRIKKRGKWGDHLLTLTDAKTLWEAGRIKKYNAAFARLVELDFDVTELLAFYQERREQIAKDARAKSGDYPME